MSHNMKNPIVPPSLDELMIRFLATRSDATASVAVESGEGEVEPHEVAAGFRIDPRAAWTDATLAIGSIPSALPQEWAAFVGQPSPAFAMAMAAGNFPQRVKDLQPLLTKFNPVGLRPAGGQAPSPGLSGLRTWIVREAKKRQPDAALIAAGVARAIGEFDWAEELLADADALSTVELRQAWENERAALLWHRGRCAEALTAWKAMPEKPAFLFNRGMALLFLGLYSDAREALTRAVATLPESSGWSTLARLYLAVADIHG